jgi:hypothetical protein
MAEPDVDRLLKGHRLLKEHRLLRGLAPMVRDPSAADFREMAESLDSHIRWEERELFPRLEQTLAKADLLALGAALASDPHHPRGSCAVQ